MLVLRQPLVRDLDVSETFRSEHELGTTGMIDAHPFPDAAISCELVPVLLDDPFEGTRPRLLFAFYEELDVDGELALDLFVEVQCSEARNQVTLVVGRATGEQTTVPDLGLE